ncbi:hypothetical protein EsH8_V_000219 [Colletotrichum jinshuiense]
MAPRSSLALALVALVAAGHSQEDRQAVQTTPSPPDTSENQLSWQSAFWALIAVALNTATQPSGRICGFPSDWGLCLKWSPVFCIINIFEALSCVSLRRGPEWALVVAPHKYGNDTTDSAHSDVASLQRNTLIRIVAFVLGPVLQATKLYACQGIIWIQVLAAIYLGSFLCDEVILSLLWMADSIEEQNHVTGLAEAILGSKARFPIRLPLLKVEAAPEAAPEDQLQESRAASRQPMAIVASHLLLMWFVVSTITGAYIKHFRVVMLIVIGMAFLGGIASGVFCGIRSYKKQRTKSQVFFDAFFGVYNVLWLSAFVVSTGAKCSNMAVVGENNVIDFHGNGTRKNWAWRIGLVLWSLEISRWARMHVTTSGPHGIPKPANVILPLWAGAHLAVAVAMFNFAHDPSQTYKPAWTDVLG